MYTDQERLESLVQGRKAFVFVVDRYSWPIHRSRCFCGVKNPRGLGGFSGRYGLYADLMGIRHGDLIFFYQRRINEPPEERGFRGIYQVVSDPFFDSEDVGLEGYQFKVLGKCPHCYSTHPERGDWVCSNCGKPIGEGNHILPIRILIKPVVYFERPVDDNTAYIDRTEKGELWTMLFRKIFGPGRQRSVNPILPEEAARLIRLLLKVNKNKRGELQLQPYNPKSPRQIDLELGKGPRVDYEHQLIAWLMRNIDKSNKGILNDIVPREELEWFGNEVMYGIGGEKVDLLCLHRGENGVRYKATVFEVKKDTIREDSLRQIERYSYWVSQLVTANAEPKIYSLELQPVLLGHRVSGSVISKVKRWRTRTIVIPYPGGRCSVTIRAPIILRYWVRRGSINIERFL